MFTSIINERAEAAVSRKIVTIITEDDIVKIDKKSPKEKHEKELTHKVGGGGGGRGAREVKMKVNIQIYNIPYVPFFLKKR